MRQTQLFSKTKKDAPKDEVSKNAALLIRGGYIHKEMAGVYSYLPLGLRVLEKIKNVIREEMNKIGGQEMIMTVLQRKELWEQTDRWNDEKVDIWFKSKLKSGGDVGLGWSHEEPITEMMKQYVSSYRDLPVFVYQFQTKLRNELRAKSGIMRGREFLMKDMYSYSVDSGEHEKFYKSVIQAYLSIFDRVGLGDKTFLTVASGGAFTQFSHEFQTVSEAGEDIIYVDRSKKIAINKEVLTEEVLKQLDVKRDELEEMKAIEVGNIFNFGDVKSKQLGLFFKDESGTQKPVLLGSYGIGITRLMGTLVEVFSDDKGIVWSDCVAPFSFHLLPIFDKDGKTKQNAEKLYKNLVDKGVEILYDDRDIRAGEKFNDADLIGLPTQIVMSEKTLNAESIELKERKSGVVKKIRLDEFLASF